MQADLRRRVEGATGRRVAAVAPLSGGCIGAVYRVELKEGVPVVVKVGTQGAGLALEGWMLDYLARRSALPVPAVHHADDALLVMDCLVADGRLDAGAEAHAAELLAALHGIGAPDYGLERDTLIGGLSQPNPPSPRWIPFYAEHRLLHMAGEAERAGRLPAATLARVGALAGRLDRWLEEPARPSLIHGDMWGGNVLCRAAPGGNRISGFVDPAIYYADAEIELAFATLFNTFGDAFFGRYRELRALAPGFFEARRELYNLYPLLTHVRLFGGGYLAQVEATLARFGV